MSLKRINLMVLMLFGLVMSCGFYYLHTASLQYLKEDKIRSIKGDILELGYLIGKMAEQGELSDTANLLFRSLAAHRSYKALHIVSEGTIMLSSDLQKVGSDMSDTFHIDTFDLDVLNRGSTFSHEFYYFDGGRKRQIELVVELDTDYLFHTEHEMIAAVEYYMYLFYAGLLLLFVVLYWINIRPLVQLGDTVGAGPHAIPKFTMREFARVRDAFVRKYQEVSELNVSLEAKIAERTERLCKTNERFNEAQQMTRLGNWEWDIVANKLSWTDEIYRIFGLEPQAFAATYEAFMHTVHRDDRTLVEEAVQHTLETGDAYVLKHRIVQAGGAVRVVMERGKVERDGSGRNLRMIGTVQDITEQQRGEDALRLQSEILDSVSDAIFVHPLGEKFIYVNDAACRTRGFSREEFLKMTVNDLDDHQFIPESEKERHFQKIKKQIDEKGIAAFEMVHRTKAGGTIPVEIVSRMITLDGKEYVISIARDITIRKQILEALETSEAKYRSLVEHSQVGVFQTDIQGTIYYVNDAMVRIFGFENAEVLMQYNMTQLYKDPADRVRMLEQLKRDKSIASYEIDIVTKSMQERSVLLSATLDGEKLNGTFMDISEAKKSRAEIEQLSTALEKIDDMVMIADKNGTVQYVNEAFVHHTGYSCEEICGKKPSLLKSGEHDQAFYETMWRTILAGEVYNNQVVNRKKNGQIYYEQKTITPLTDEQGNITTLVSTGKDVTETVILQQRLELLATMDKLTGIYNRHRFEELYDQEIKRILRYESPLSMIMFDIDHFKRINDTFGHDTGDIVLRQVSDVVTNVIRKVDIFGRWGGEEFLILCPETEYKDALALAEKIRGKLEAGRFVKIGTVTASFGVSSFIPGENRENLFKRVDDALYRAKKHGRNRVEGNV